jgi:hypothetical protein
VRGAGVALHAGAEPVPSEQPPNSTSMPEAV